MSGGRLLFEARADGKHPNLLSCHMDIPHRASPTRQAFSLSGVVLPPGEAGPCLGTSVVVTTRGVGAPGIEAVGAGDALQHPQSPGWSHRG